MVDRLNRGKAVIGRLAEGAGALGRVAYVCTVRFGWFMVVSPVLVTGAVFGFLVCEESNYVSFESGNDVCPQKISGVVNLCMETVGTNWRTSPHNSFVPCVKIRAV